jgi:hypothetical protein
MSSLENGTARTAKFFEAVEELIDDEDARPKRRNTRAAATSDYHPA